jgi:tryptophan synthase alpha chain
MSRIAQRFAELRARKEGALIPFLVGGAPQPQTFQAVIEVVAKSGADVIEVGVPFSDPLADGPQIQAASERALAVGVTLEGVLQMVGQFRAQCETPVVIMTYYNPVLQYGLSEFAGAAAEAGVDGVIISDLPPEEAGPWKKAAEAAGLDTVFLLAPTSTAERIRLVADLAGGFIYCVSRTGVTGARRELSRDLAPLVERIRAETDKPIAVGFGISSPDQVREVCRAADGAVVGSALVDLIAREGEAPELSARVGEFVTGLKQATIAAR